MQSDAGIPHETGRKGGLKGWHVLLMFLGFFGVMLTVNGIFLTSAIKSFPGEDVEESYIQGIEFNDVLESRRMQEELGWQAEAGVQNGEILFRLSDRDGAPLGYREIDGQLRHPGNLALDRSIVFEPTARGEYVYAIEENLPSGRWTLQVDVKDAPGGNTVFTARKTLFVP